MVVTQTPHGPEQWPTTTHVWAHPVDTEHLAAIAADPDRFAAGGLTHLVLEVLAYAAEEAEARGVIGRADVVVRPDGSVEVCDDGRGTQTRRDETGQVIRKPVMATRDVRFFGTDAERLADGLPRNGMSVVAAQSIWLRHTNHRVEGSWTQVYEHGVPVAEMTEAAGTGRTGTCVHFLPDAAVVPTAQDSVALDAGVLTADPRLSVTLRRLDD